MWLMTTFGFFSVVQKPGDEGLTVRSRSRADLEALQEKYLPSLGPISANAGTDYEYRATASHSDVAAALAAIVGDIDYSNFKSEVTSRQGYQRAHIYSKVWSDLHAIADEE